MEILKNNVQLIGTLGRNPDVRHLENGKSVARFSIATSDQIKTTTGETALETHWHNIVAWGSYARFAEKFIRKGMRVCLTGQLTHQTYHDASGVTRTVTEVQVREMLIMNSKRNG